jgi:hypothetical protein
LFCILLHLIRLKLFLIYFILSLLVKLLIFSIFILCLNSFFLIFVIFSIKVSVLLLLCLIKQVIIIHSIISMIIWIILSYKIWIIFDIISLIRNISLILYALVWLWILLFQNNLIINIFMEYSRSILIFL